LLDKHIAIGGAHGEAQKIKDHLNGAMIIITNLLDAAV